MNAVVDEDVIGHGSEHHRLDGREIVALRLMTAIGDSFDRNEEPAPAIALAPAPTGGSPDAPAPETGGMSGWPALSSSMLALSSSIS